MQVSKDIKYADKQPIIPWGPRFVIAFHGSWHGSSVAVYCSIMLQCAWEFLPCYFPALKFHPLYGWIVLIMMSFILDVIQLLIYCGWDYAEGNSLLCYVLTVWKENLIFPAVCVTEIYFQCQFHSVLNFLQVKFFPLSLSSVILLSATWSFWHYLTSLQFQVC
jgi:hypothetical protein